MRYLIEIARVLTRNKVSKIEIFDERALRSKDSKFNKFYQALLTNKFKTDRDAAAYLYGCTPSDPKYRQLKSRFRKRLFNTLFFLDMNQPAASNYDRAYYTCSKEWVVAQALVWYGAQESAAQLARQLLSVALKFRFADLIVNCCRLLREDSAQRGDERGYEAYHAYIQEYADILQAELRAEELHQRVLMRYAAGGLKPDDQIDACCDALLALSEQHGTPNVFYYMYMAWVYRYELQQDFDGMLAVCERGEQYLEQHSIGQHEQKIAAFQIKKMAAFVHLENYREGRSNAERSLRLISEGSAHWFAFMEYYFLLAMHTGHYIHALAIFKQAKELPQSAKLDEAAHEKWKVFEAYCDYIIFSERKNAPVLESQAGMRATPGSPGSAALPHAKGQRIYEVLLLTAQILTLLESKTYSGLPERIERLKKLANNQLRKEHHYRPVQFIRLLQQLPKANFKREELTNTEKYYKGLQQRPFFYRGKAHELEVIPYEKLWGRILSALA